MKFGLIKMGCSDSIDSNSDVDCNGRGECVELNQGNKTCICEIKFNGDYCSSFNKYYYAGEHLSVMMG